MIMDAELSRARFERDLMPFRSNPAEYQHSGILLASVGYASIVVELDWYQQAKKLLLKVLANDWDYRPPMGWWIDCHDTPLLNGIPNGGGFQIASHPHGENRAWFCFPGWREFHDHQSHQLPSWAFLRSTYRLMKLIVQLKADLNKPGVSLHAI
jgi:hypothetical protein